MHVLAKSSVGQVFEILYVYVTEVSGLYKLTRGKSAVLLIQWGGKSGSKRFLIEKYKWKNLMGFYPSELGHTTHSYSTLHGDLPGLELFAIKSY